jgi:hypothetical protein
MKPNTPFGGKKFDFKKVIEWLGLVLKCPICGQKYKMDSTKVIESEENTLVGEARLLIHSDCSKCKSSVMFNIEINGPEIFSVGMVTDLTSRDSSKFKNKTPISTNEVIGMHQELKKFKGDFVGTFTEKL